MLSTHMSVCMSPLEQQPSTFSAIHGGVPATGPTVVVTNEATCVSSHEILKSVTTVMLLASISTLIGGLRSQWLSPAAWIQANVCTISSDRHSWAIKRLDKFEIVQHCV